MASPRHSRNRLLLPQIHPIPSALESEAPDHSVRVPVVMPMALPTHRRVHGEIRGERETISVDKRVPRTDVGPILPRCATPARIDGRGTPRRSEPVVNSLVCSGFCQPHAPTPEHNRALTRTGRLRRKVDTRETVERRPANDAHDLVWWLSFDLARMVGRRHHQTWVPMFPPALVMHRAPRLAMRGLAATIDAALASHTASISRLISTLRRSGRIFR